MYLKEIDLYGFKSFADKTSIVFSPNINGIVGPNGSGKSNVLDAVKFVLGEQSSKNLRGDGSINDVIFSGSKSRKPLSSASVTLIFDNADNSLPINFPEVSIKRTVYKSGENEYFINGERCRLKDITDLMLDTSSSKESFNIIGQGKISQIISSKLVDRRGVFEEAAGVLKYKKRKEEAIRKLEKTNDNLVRVNDIINELMTNLKPLEVQSKDAKKYLSLKDNLSNLEISLMVFDIEKLNFNYKESKRQIDLINDELLSMNSSSSISDTSILENKDKLKKLDEEINEKQNILLTITSKLENLKSSLRVLQERKKYTKETSVLKDSVDNLNKTLLDIETKINNLNNNIIINEKEYSNLLDSIKNKENSYNELKNKVNKLIDSITRSKREDNDILYRIEYLENVVNNNSNLPNSVKNILNNPKFKVHNIIGKLIDMEEKYQLAVSTSLGIASSYIVTDNEEEAGKCVHYLKDNNLGRATFYPLNIIKPRYIPSNIINSIKDVEGYVDIASNVVKYDKKYENIILNQLGNVIVSTNIECANNIAKKINHAYKIVTMDGNIINVGGSITGGSNIKNNILKEKYEIDNYQNKHRLLVEKIKNEENSLTNYEKELHNYENDLYELRNKNNLINDLISNKREELNKLSDERLSIKNNLDSYNGLLSNKEDLEEAKLYNDITLTTKERDNVLTSINVLKMDKDNVSEIITNLESVTKKNSAYISKKEKQLKELEILVNRIEVKLDNILLDLTNEYNMTYENAKSKYKLEIDANDAREKVNNLKGQIKDLGTVNLGSIEEYDRVNERYNFLTKQKEDLDTASDTLLEIINSMDEVMKERFSTTFDKINIEFARVFKELFKGGNASLRLTEPNNLLETGIEISAEPPGKSLKSINALSGGEQTFTAISLLFAILNVKKVPFCIFDEVEAALDEANVDSFGTYLDKYHDKTQFIIITHKKKTMEYANILYGITMQESGVSRLVSVKLEEINKEG